MNAMSGFFKAKGSAPGAPAPAAAAASSSVENEYFENGEDESVVEDPSSTTQTPPPPPVPANKPVKPAKPPPKPAPYNTNNLNLTVNPLRGSNNELHEISMEDDVEAAKNTKNNNNNSKGNNSFSGSFRGSFKGVNTATLHQYRFWIAAACIFGLVLIIAPIAAYYGSTSPSGTAPASTVINSAAASAFVVSPSGDLTLSTSSLLKIPNFGGALITATGVDTVVLRQATKITDKVTSWARKTWITQAKALLPFATSDLVSQTYCGKTTLYGIFNTDCCMTITLDSVGDKFLTLDSMVSPADVQGFLSCDFNSTWSPLISVPGLAQAVSSLPGSWFTSLQFTSSGKFVISSVNVERSDISIRAGLNLFANGALIAPPASVTAALNPLLNKPAGSVEFVVAAFFPYNKDTKAFTVTNSEISLFAATADLTFGSTLVSGSLALGILGLGSSPSYNLNGVISVNYNKDDGASNPILFGFTSSYSVGEPVLATGKLFGPIALFSTGGWATLSSATITAQFTAPPAFKLTSIEFVGQGKLGFGDSPSNTVSLYAKIEAVSGSSYNIGVYAPSISLSNIGELIASKAPGAVANVIKAFTANKVVGISIANNDIIVGGTPLKRGLGISVNNVPLSDAVSEGLATAISSATSAINSAKNIQVTAFLPLFTTGTTYTVQVTAKNIVVNSRLQFNNVYFSTVVSSTFSTANLGFGGVILVYLPNDQVVSFNVAGSYTTATSTFSATGGLAAPWVRPFGIPVLTVSSATATLTLSSSTTSVKFDTTLRLDYSDAKPSVTLSGTYQDGSFYIYNPSGNSISSFLPTIVKQHIDFDGTVYLYLSTADQTLSGRAVSRGLTLAAENLTLKPSSSPITQTLSNILGAVLPNGIPNVKLYYPIFGSMGSSATRRDLVSDLYGLRVDRTWSTQMNFPNINLWSNTLALVNNTIGASFSTSNVAATTFKLSTTVSFNSNGQTFAYPTTASFGSGSTSLSFSGTLPQWTNPLGISWLSVGPTTVSASFSSSNSANNRLDVGTRLYFGPSAAPTVNVAVRGQLASAGMFLAVYDLSASAVASLVSHALLQLAPIPNANSLVQQLSGLNIGFAISTNPNKIMFTADSGKQYEVEKGISFIVSTQTNARVCTASELTTRSDCENPTISLIKQLVPSQFRSLGFRFGVVVPVSATGVGFKLFVQTENAIALHSRLSLVWLKLSAEFSIGGTRRELLANTVAEINSIAEYMKHPADAPLSHELLHAYHTRLRRAGATGSLEITTKFSFKADSTSTLYFQVSGQIVSDATGVSVRAFGFMYGSGWKNAFGISGLTINAATVGLGFGTLCPPCVTFVQLGASISIGRRTVAFVGALDINSFGGFFRASYSGTPLTLIDLLQLVNVLKPNTINMNALPSWLSDVFALRALTIQIASANMVIPDVTQITASNNKQISDLPMLSISAGFVFNASLTVIAVDTDIYIAYIQSPVPDLRMSLMFSFAKINARLDAFTNNLRNLNGVPILSDILNIPEVKNILEFRVNSISVTDFSTLGMISGTQFPTASLSYTYAGNTKTVSFTLKSLGVDLIDILVQNVDAFPNCLVDSMCPSGQKCYHNNGGAWRCGAINSDGSCKNGMFSYMGTGCWSSNFIDQFVGWAKDVSDAFEDGFNAAENGVNDAINKIKGVFG